MQALDNNNRTHGWFLRDHKYLVKPDVLFEGSEPEDYTDLFTDSELEEVMNMPQVGLPLRLSVACRLRINEGRKKGSKFLQTRKYTRMSIAEYAKLKGYYIVLDSDEISLNPFFEGNLH